MPSSTPEAAQIQLVQRLFIQFSAPLRGFVVSLCPDFSTVDDVLQETFLTITRKAESFEPGSNFYAFACAVAKFKILEAGRGSHRAPLFSPEVIESLAACAPEPDEERRSLQLSLLGGCLEKLPPQMRRAVDLRYQQAHKPVEVARQLGWGAESVYVTLSRARDLLRNCVARGFSELDAL